MSYQLTWLADVLRSAGLSVSEVKGWQTRGHGDMGHVVGVVCHHTAGPDAHHGTMPSLNTVVYGRPGLAGPLCNLALGRDGVWYVVAAGCAWHAGVGTWKGLTAGNRQFIGIEAENTGYIKGPTAEQPWSAIEMESYARGCAALLTKIGQPASWVIGHKEWAPKRKVDPTFDMDAFRSRVSSYMPKPKGSLKGVIKRNFLIQSPNRNDIRDGCCTHGETK